MQVSNNCVNIGKFAYTATSFFRQDPPFWGKIISFYRLNSCIPDTQIEGKIAVVLTSVCAELKRK